MNNIFTLESWLQIATKDLTPEAVVSIRKEITEHVKTTLEYQTNAGLSQVEAEKVAVTLLGDPKKSAKKFYRIHLTNIDSYIIGLLNSLKLIILLTSVSQVFVGIFGFLNGISAYQNGKDAFNDVPKNIEYLSWQIKGILWSLEYLYHLILNFSFVILIGVIHWIKKVNRFEMIIKLNWFINIVAISVFLIRLFIYFNFKPTLEKYHAGVTIVSFGTVSLLYGVFWLIVANPLFRKLSTRATI